MIFCRIRLRIKSTYLTAFWHSTIPQRKKEKRRTLLAKISVIGAYIKRRGNLMFIGEKSETTDTAELSLCLEESFANLELMGVDCAIDIPNSNTIFTKDAIRVYDFFETVTEAAMYNLHSVWLKGRSFSDYVSFHLEVECDSQLSDFYQLAENGYFEDGIWRWCIYRSNIFRCYRALRK